MGKRPCTLSPPQETGRGLRKCRFWSTGTSSFPRPGDLCATAITWQGVPPAALQKRFSFYLLPILGKRLAPRCLAPRGTALAAHYFPRAPPSPSYTGSTHCKQLQAARWGSWGCGVPGDQDSPTSSKQERGCKICAWSGPGHEFWWVFTPLFPGSSGPRERDPIVGLHPCLLQPTLLLPPTLLGTVLVPCPLREHEPGRPPHCSRLCL